MSWHSSSLNILHCQDSVAKAYHTPKFYPFGHVITCQKDRPLPRLRGARDPNVTFVLGLSDRAFGARSCDGTIDCYSVLSMLRRTGAFLSGTVWELLFGGVWSSPAEPIEQGLPSSKFTEQDLNSLPGVQRLCMFGTTTTISVVAGISVCRALCRRGQRRRGRRASREAVGSPTGREVWAQLGLSRQSSGLSSLSSGLSRQTSTLSRQVSTVSRQISVLRSNLELAEGTSHELKLAGGFIGEARPRLISASSPLPTLYSPRMARHPALGSPRRASTGSVGILGPSIQTPRAGVRRFSSPELPGALSTGDFIRQLTPDEKDAFDTFSQVRGSSWSEMDTVEELDWPEEMQQEVEESVFDDDSSSDSGSSFTDSDF